MTSKKERTKSDEATQNKSKASNREKSKSETKKSTKSAKISETSENDVERIRAAGYFMEWTKNVLTQYGSLIWDLYVVPLEELCTRKNEEATLLKKDLNMLDQLTADTAQGKALKKAVERANRWPSVEGNYKPTTRDRFLTMAEAACYYKLKQAVKVLGSLMGVLARFKDFLDSNMKLMQKHSAECALILVSALRAFDAACTLAEVFDLQPVDRATCLSLFKKYMNTYEIPPAKNINVPLEIHPEVRKYEKKLEAQIGYFRTVVYLAGKAMIDMAEHMLLSFQNTFLEEAASETKMILDRLPGQFMYPEPLLLSLYAMEVLQNPPPNKYSLAATREILEEFSLVDSSRSQSTLRTASTRGNSSKTVNAKASAKSQRKSEKSQKKAAYKSDKSNKSATDGSKRHEKSNSFRSASDELEDTQEGDESPPTARDVRHS
ncbi:hypothetical protein L596_021726 [Steinernema carpocapsae]|uniref:Uncharacterized protein n=1 Tax=Steinernema carpocapsae TaxID=34508 RepID=A0A4U5MJL3_STECR|nr:hypothetical protein L596_021726 [Steinernema carpocapsae]